jgi:quercetin dioxygenase-like cupin family protein
MYELRQQIETDWASRGFSCELWTDPPGQRWEDFTHATDELVTVLEGDMEFEIEGVRHHPQPGQELLIPAGTLQSARNIGSTTVRWLFGYRRA